jgi:RES domain-containing protein
LYMSESRALAVLEVLVHLAIEIPDKYVMGEAELPWDLETVTVSESELPTGWQTPISAQQTATRQIGDKWVRGGQSAVLSLPSVIVDERNFVLNPAHADFRRIAFRVPKPFEFDGRLLGARV